MVLVHQMAKVGSRSWVEAARSSPLTVNVRPIHCHYVVRANRDRLKDALAWSGDNQTISNRILPNRLGRSVTELVQAALDRQEKIRVVSGVRDPVSRSISLILFFRDFYGHVSLPFGPHISVSPDYVMTALRENWRLVLERREPRQSFEWLLWYMTNSFRSWFSEELGAAFAVDVLDRPFPLNVPTQRIATHQAEILIYRMEDMFPESSRQPRLLEDAAVFLETPITAFPHVNASANRRSRELAAEVRRRFRLPADMLDAIYGEPVVRHFYSDPEIAAFKQRWAGERIAGAD